MRILADDTAFAEKALSGSRPWKLLDPNALPPEESEAVATFLRGRKVHDALMEEIEDWSLACLASTVSASQFDLLIDTIRSRKPLPDRMIVLAGQGSGFHGQRGRTWTSGPGNIHLCVHFIPRRPIENPAGAFPILSAVSLIETLDGLPGLDGRAGIKWVNDVLIEGAKVAGFLVHTSSLGERVTQVVLGIGLNVEHRPEVPPDPFVPKVASLSDFIADSNVCSHRSVLRRLLTRLAANIDLIQAGTSSALLDLYRERSLVLGRSVRIMTDPEDGSSREITAGRVLDIGPGLELTLEGRSEPVTRGRLVLLD